jgi:hypothetical protein
VRLSKILAVALRPILGLYLLLCALLVSISALALPVVSFGQYLGSPTVSIEIILLLFGLGMIWLASLEPAKSWIVQLSLGVVSTLMSAVYVVGNSPPLVGCAILFSDSGFPFPWYRAARFYEAPGGPLCLYPSIPPPRVDTLSFMLDTIFYLGLYFAALETFRGIGSLYQRMSTGRNLGAQHGPIPEV